MGNTWPISTAGRPISVQHKRRILLGQTHFLHEQIDPIAETALCVRDGLRPAGGAGRVQNQADAVFGGESERQLPRRFERQPVERDGPLVRVPRRDDPLRTGALLGAQTLEKGAFGHERAGRAVGQHIRDLDRRQTQASGTATRPARKAAKSVTMASGLSLRS